MRVPRRRTIGYIGLLAGGLVVSLLFGFSSFAAQIDTDAYDWMFRAWAPEPWQPRAIILAIDEPTLLNMGGVPRLRTYLADGLERVTAARPKVVALDLTLADQGNGPEDSRLEAVLAKVPNLVLDCDMMPDGASWQEPYALFRRYAAAIGHAHAYPDRLDAVSRAIPLELIAGRSRRWALSLETFRLDSGQSTILESPSDLEIGQTLIPAPRSTGRAMRIRYLPPKEDGSPRIPRISFYDLSRKPDLVSNFRDRAVFVGVTAQTLVRDRLFTPYSDRIPMPGVEIHASAYETMRTGFFLTDAPDSAVVVFCLLLTAAIGLTFALLSGWYGYALGGLLVLVAHVMPHVLFRYGTVFPLTAPLSSVWIASVGAASWQHFVVRRQLRKSERDKARYQHAIHFVTHEMRSPLTAIQGSSELISRYTMNDEKRKQIALTINSESKRLARMVQTFLDVERLSEGQMELRKESFPIEALLKACEDRARPLAERKQIEVTLEPCPPVSLTGDRELMEYAVYNLLTNAIKYSPAETHVWVRVTGNGQECRLSVTDQGIGMDEKELRNIFRKFYRTAKAERSGEAGTGIGLSIVEQIVTSHGGRMEVTSVPDKGSCFTMIVPCINVQVNNHQG